MFSLVVQSGKHKGRQIELPDNKELVVGREQGCFLRLASQDVSRHHCMLIRTSRGWLLRDLRSQNGTQVNGVRISGETILQPGDRLRIGPLEFQFAGPPPRVKRDELESDIVNWLADDSSVDMNARPSDTTIIPADALRSGASGTLPVMRLEEGANLARVSATMSATATPPQISSEIEVPPPIKSEFDSVSEEGRDIVRRHLEWVQMRRAAGLI